MNWQFDSPMAERAKAKVYTRYPLSGILIYNGTTILHYLLGESE